MTIAERRLRSATVPRYTSYPPANLFSPSVGEGETAAWLAGTPADRPVSLYLHVPFCRRLCHFCACRTQGTRTDAPVEAYVGRLEREIALVARHLPARMTASAVHFGGGTPTILAPAHLHRIGRALRDAFDLTPQTEFAVEVDPCEIDAARMDALAAIGMTRASIGVQDFAPAIQEAIGRIQSPRDTQRVAEGLRARGIRSLNVDLLYGLPHQTAQTLRDTLAHVDAIRPERIAFYGYAHVPWAARRQRLIDAEALPDADARVALFETGHRLLSWAGYGQVGIDHFALPEDSLSRAAATGRLHRNFQGYTTDAAETLIGFGASALSRFPAGHAQNAPGTRDWSAAIDAGRLATVRGRALSPEDRARAEAIERLMCDFRADLAGIAARHGIDAAGLLDDARRLVAELPGEARLGDGGVALVHRDGRFARLAASYFDRYFAAGGQAYSRAI